MSAQFTSIYWRQEGNKFYGKAQHAGSLESTASYLKEAIQAYEEAFNSAKRDDESCLALRNLGMANWRLGQNCNYRALAATAEKQENGRTYCYSSSHRTDYNPYIMLHFYKQAIGAFCRTFPLVYALKGNAPAGDVKNSMNVDDFLTKLQKNVDDTSKEALGFLKNMDYFPTYKSRIEHLDHLIGAFGKSCLDWIAVFNLEKAKTLHKWAVTEMDRSGNYAFVLNCLKQCYSPIETIRRLIPSKILENESPFGHYQGDRYKEWQDLNTSIQVDTSVAEAMKCIQEGDELLRMSIFDTEQANISGVYAAIDKYQSAVIALNNGGADDPRLEAVAASKIGQVYYNILKNETRTRRFCLEAVSLASRIQGHNFAGQEWFDKATSILRELQEKQRREEEEQALRDREPVLKDLERDLEKLKWFREKSAEYLITELPIKFPPKHKKNSPILTDLASMKFDSKTPRSTVKKALAKLILMYHPDHVHDEDGREWKVMCEEITKLINGKYMAFTCAAEC